MSDVILFLTPKQTVGEFIADLNSMDKNLLNQIWPSPCIFMVENETVNSPLRAIVSAPTSTAKLKQVHPLPKSSPEYCCSGLVCTHKILPSVFSF